MGPGRGREGERKWEGRRGKGGDGKRKEEKGGKRGNGSMHPLGFSKVGAYEYYVCRAAILV